MHPEIVTSLLEDALLQRALDGDREADTEVSARAMAGSFRCQVGLLAALGQSLGAGQISTANYLEHAEVLARLAAASGDWMERRRLAALLDVKARKLSDDGSHNASVTAHVECAIILNRLADDGDDEALALLDGFSANMHPDALVVANMGLKAVRPLLQRPANPSVEQSPSLLGDLPLPTRREQIGWWFQDRWEVVRAWCCDPAWELRRLWWAVSGRLRGWK